MFFQGFEGNLTTSVWNFAAKKHFNSLLCQTVLWKANPIQVLEARHKAYILNP